MNLHSYTVAVNRLARESCSSINAERDIYGATHSNVSEDVVRRYYDQGLTPMECMRRVFPAALPRVGRCRRDR